MAAASSESDGCSGMRTHSARSDTERKDAAHVALRPSALFRPHIEGVLHGPHLRLRGRRLADDTFADQRLDDVGAQDERVPTVETEKIHCRRAAEAGGVLLEVLHEADLVAWRPALQERAERAVLLGGVDEKAGIGDG